ncbi:methyltransferase domain-containing protein [Anabaena sphaerica FACHB-251]|uniref:Methyltransferase domain-containing protein n=1 Tax=Anabaena sphaerica FACHB-251 TaxID=2692883 RepID=A0A927A0V5_9NOST|nr:methyltransferase domain-containing protein [Anabaena sphaerica]MBD2295372.1 methyltransferase domain-containing protein [Anabaena sphaerica FACHB-251]
MTTVKQARWQAAQLAESQYWDGMNITELLRICTEKPDFLSILSQEQLQYLFDDKEILEIGVGPLGISLASFYPEKHKIKKLVKLEPLARTLITESSLIQQIWARPFIDWISSLSEEGNYIQKSGEQMEYEEEFDTVIIYNVLDHVKDPLLILRNAYKSIRSGGQILVGVDCRSILGQIKFEYILRRIAKDEILVKAHPHTFLHHQVVQLLEEAGFDHVQTIGIPSLIHIFMGSSFRPAFIAEKRR